MSFGRRSDGLHCLYFDGDGISWGWMGFWFVMAQSLCAHFCLLGSFIHRLRFAFARLKAFMNIIEKNKG